MFLNDLKDVLFDAINESDLFQLNDLIADDAENTLTVILENGMEYLIKVSEIPTKKA